MRSHLQIIRLFFIAIALSIQLNAQKKILVLGSSTSSCFFGPSSFENCYLTKLQRYYESVGTPIVFDNRAVAGDNCYQGMPTWYTPPGGRSLPRPYNNISEGLLGNPDVVLVNFPSNGYDVFSVDEVLFCLRTIKQTANNAGKPCYITTSQPRNDPESFRTAETRRKMAEIKDRVQSEFGQFAINFWDEIVNPADNSIKAQYDADGTHLNDAGHQILFTRVRDRNIIGSNTGDMNPPTVPGNLRMVAQGPNNLSLDWDESFDNQGIARYEIFENGSLKYTSPLSHLAISGLQPSTVYNYFVRAVDPSGNVSGNSNSVSGSTSGNPTPHPGGGLNFRYYEGSWNALPDFNSLTPVKTGTSANLDLSVSNRSDLFGMVWEGFIQIPVSGTYTFELSSDDGSRFYINSNYNNNATPLLNNDGLHGDQNIVSASIYLNAGAYPMAASFFEAYGNETMRLIWSGPNIPRQQVPNSAFGQAQQPSSGVNYRYYEGDWNSLPNFSLMSPVKSGVTSNVDLSQRNRNDYFGFVWEGYLHVPVSGNYTFELESDDGSNFYFNTLYNAFASPTVYNDGLHGASPAAQNTIFINAGAYPVSASFFEKWGDETMRLYWTGPSIQRQVIPGSAFTPTANGFAASAGNEVGIASSARDRNATSVTNIFPNPFVDRLNLDIAIGTESRSSYVEIFDLFGKLLKRQELGLLHRGSNHINLVLPELAGKPQGMYILKAHIDKEKARTFKIFKGKPQ